MVGFDRNLKSVVMGSTPAFPFKDDDQGWGTHVEGAMGECALAKWLKMPWTGAERFYAHGDIGCIQVRTAARDSDCLIVRDRDDPMQPYVLLTGKYGFYTARGWLFAFEAMIDRYRRDSTSWFVPQPFLKSMGLLRDAIAKK